MHLQDFHTHTFRCKHARGDVPDFVARANAIGLHAIGLSDHMPYPDDRWTSYRMGYAELDELTRVMHEAREGASGCRVYTGLECEWTPAYKSYYEDELLGERRLDYLIGSTHFTPVGSQWLCSFSGLSEARHLRAYVDHTIALLDTGLFAFVAHPDVFSLCFRRWTPDVAAATRDLMQAVRDRDAVLELNASGFRKEGCTYPWRPFWEAAAEHGVNVVVNSDAHAPEELFAEVPRCHALADELGLNLVDLEARIRGGARRAG